MKIPKQTPALHSYASSSHDSENSPQSTSVIDASNVDLIPLSAENLIFFLEAFKNGNFLPATYDPSTAQISIFNYEQ